MNTGESRGRVETSSRCECPEKQLFSSIGRARPRGWQIIIIEMYIFYTNEAENTIATEP